MSESEEPQTDTDADEEATEQQMATENLPGLTGDVDADRPDPADLDPIEKEEAEHKRDADGNLKTSYHAVQFKSEWRRIGLKPLVPEEADELQDKFQGAGDNIEIGEIFPFLEEYVREPEGVDWRVAKFPVIMSAVKALGREINGEDDSGFQKAVRAELAERADENEEGN